MSALVMVDLQAQRRRLGPAIDEAIGRVLAHGRFVGGPEIARFEEELAAFAGVQHVVTCSSGTDALVLSLMALGVGAGDVVAVPAFTFAATAEAVVLAGANPLFVDVDPETFLLDPIALNRAVTACRQEGVDVVGVIPVDLFGQPAVGPELEAVATESGLWLLVDGAQSMGAIRDGKAVGTAGSVTATSFFPSKPLGCYGDGGAVLTDDASLASVVRSLRSHGEGAAAYDHRRVGLCARLDTIQAAVLLEKLRVFPDELEARQRVAARYDELLAGLVRTPRTAPGVRSAWAQYTVLVPRREAVRAVLERLGVPSAVHYPRSLHEQPAFAGVATGAGGVPVTEGLCAEVLSLPMHPYLEDADQDRVVEALARALDEVAP